MKIYLTLIIPILLYGSETWQLLKTDQNKLEYFHRRCLRTICNISQWSQWKKRITSKEIEESLNVLSMEHYLQVRVLTWAAKIVRMDYNRLPRKFLFGWVENRRDGRPFLTFAHRVKRVVKAALKKVNSKVKKVMLTLAGRKNTNRDQIDWVKLTRHKRAWKWLVNAGDAQKKGCQCIATFCIYYEKAVESIEKSNTRN